MDRVNLVREGFEAWNSEDPRVQEFYDRDTAMKAAGLSS
jgi:hypothetical protein